MFKFKEFFMRAYEKALDFLFNIENEKAREEYVRQCRMSYSGATPFDVGKYEVEARKYNPERAQSSEAKDLFTGEKKSGGDRAVKDNIGRGGFGRGGFER